MELWQKEGTTLLPATSADGGATMVAAHRQLHLLHFLVDGLGKCGVVGPVWGADCRPYGSVGQLVRPKHGLAPPPTSWPPRRAWLKPIGLARESRADSPWVDGAWRPYPTYPVSSEDEELWDCCCTLDPAPESKGGGRITLRLSWRALSAMAPAAVVDQP